MRRLGDKISSKLLAEQAQIRLHPGAEDRWKPSTDAWHHAERLGYPFSSRRPPAAEVTGSGGCNSPGQLREGIRERPRRGVQGLRRSHRLHGATGQPARATSRSRSLPTTTARPGRPACVTARSNAAIRRCWKKRRRRLSRWNRIKACARAAIRLSQAAGYHNAGTVEFLYEPASQRFLVHGDEHPLAGRTSGHGMHHRHRLWSSCRSMLRAAGAWKAIRRARPVTPSKCG